MRIWNNRTNEMQGQPKKKIIDSIFNGYYFQACSMFLLIPFHHANELNHSEKE